jgi:hypothetical protein
MMSYSGAALLLLYIVIIASRYGWRRRKAAPS